MSNKTLLALMSVMFLATEMTAQVPTASSAPPATLRLSVQDAETLALRNNPQVSVYRLLALASQQV